MRNIPALFAMAAAIVSFQLHAAPAAGIHIGLELPSGPDNPRNSEGAFLPLKDGRILFAYSRYYGDRSDDNAPADIAARYSSDNGHTWTTNDEIIVRNERGMNVMSVSLLRLQSGEIALFYLRKNSTTDCRPVLRRSFDEGRTWSEPTECITDEVGYYCLNNDRVIQLKDGRLIFALALHTWTDGNFNHPGQLFVYISDDNGVTWRRGTPVPDVRSPDGRSLAAQEPGVVELKDGRILMWIRTNGGCQYMCHSADRGETWSEPRPSPLVSPLSPASIKRLPTGDLLALWNDHASHPEMKTKGEAWANGWRSPLAAAISRDEGATWDNVRLVEDDPDGWFCYIAIEPLDDGTVLLGYCAYRFLRHSRVVKVPIDWFYEQTTESTTKNSFATRMPKLDSSAFDFKYEMEVLPTAEDLDNDGTPDFSLSVNGRSILEAGVGCGLIDCMSDGCCYIQSVDSTGVWAGYGASAATGFTVEARFALRNHGSGMYAMSLAASVPDSNVRALLNFSVENGTTFRAWWGDTSLTNMVHDKQFHTWRIARAANAATYSVWCDGVLVARELGGANADDWGLLLGSASRSWKSAAYVSYLRFTKGGYAPTIEERGSEAFAHKYEMDTGDARLSATATTADWMLTVGSGVSAALGGGGVLSASVPQGQLCYWQSGPMDSSVTEASPFTLEMRFRVHDSWEAEGKVFSIWCGTPREYAYLIFGTNSVRWVDKDRQEHMLDTNDNSDAMHVFRIAFSGDGDTVVGGFTLWRDGERVPGIIKACAMGNDENCVIFGVGSKSYGGSFELDYVRWTTDGVFAPVTPPMATAFCVL